MQEFFAKIGFEMHWHTWDEAIRWLASSPNDVVLGSTSEIYLDRVALD